MCCRFQSVVPCRLSCSRISGGLDRAGSRRVVAGLHREPGLADEQILGLLTRGRGDPMPGQYVLTGQDRAVLQACQPEGVAEPGGDFAVSRWPADDQRAEQQAVFELADAHGAYRAARGGEDLGGPARGSPSSGDSQAGSTRWPGSPASTARTRAGKVTTFVMCSSVMTWVLSPRPVARVSSGYSAVSSRPSWLRPLCRRLLTAATVTPSFAAISRTVSPS